MSPKLNFSNFTNSRNRVGGIAPNGGPIRRKKEPNLFQSIVGVFVGLLLVLGAPIVMWMGQNQRTADDFDGATETAAETLTEGYVKLRGTPVYTDEDMGGSACLNSDCLYQRESLQELVTETKLVCGNVREDEDTRILRENGVECDDSGNCQTCYDVEQDTWEEQSAVVSLYDVTIGEYEVRPSESAIYLETTEEIIETGFDDETFNETRSVYTYFERPQMLTVAGNASNGVVRPAEGKAYVFSSFDFEETYTRLKERDAQNRLVLYIITFVMLFIGFGMMLGPVQWLGRQANMVPVLGPLLAQGSKGIIALVSLLLALVIWIILFVLVALLKYWWLGILVVLLIAGFIWWRVQAAKKASK